MKRFAGLLCFLGTAVAFAQSGMQAASAPATASDGTPANIAARDSVAPSYGEKVRRRIRANLQWHGGTATSPAVILVNCSPNGKLLSATIARSSGDSAWDDAALEAVQKSDPMPIDVNGKAPARFLITYYQTHN
jgi:colicin import membrane protein